MKVSIITIGLGIFYFTVSSASPQGGGSSNPCYCRFPNSNKCKIKIQRIGCSAPGGVVTTTESAYTSSGKFAFIIDSRSI